MTFMGQISTGNATLFIIFYSFKSDLIQEIINEHSPAALPRPCSPPANLFLPPPFCQPPRTHPQSSSRSKQPVLVARGTGHQVSDHGNVPASKSVYGYSSARAVTCRPVSKGANLSTRSEHFYSTGGQMLSFAVTFLVRRFEIETV